MFHLISQDGMTPAGKVSGQQPPSTASQADIEGVRTAFADLMNHSTPRAEATAPGPVAGGRPDGQGAGANGEGGGSDKGDADPVPADALGIAGQAEDGIGSQGLEDILPGLSSVALEPSDHSARIVGDDPSESGALPFGIASPDARPIPDASRPGLSSGPVPSTSARSAATSVLQHRFSTDAVSGLTSRLDHVEANYAVLSARSTGPEELNIRQGQWPAPQPGVQTGLSAARGGVTPVSAMSLGDGVGSIARDLPGVSLTGAGLADPTAPPGTSSLSAAALMAANPETQGGGSARSMVAAHLNHVGSNLANAPTEPAAVRIEGSGWTGGAAFVAGYAPVTLPASYMGTVLPVAMATSATVTASGVSSVIARAAMSDHQRSATGSDATLSDALLSRGTDREMATAATALPQGMAASGTPFSSPSHASAFLTVAHMTTKTVAEAAVQRMSLAGSVLDGAEEVLPEEVGALAVEPARADPASGVGRIASGYGSNATMSAAQGAATQIALAVANGDGVRTELVLDPEELGKVRLNMVSDEQSITMFVMAERPETLDLLRRNIDILAQEFRELGFSNVTFAFGDGGTSDNPANTRSSNASADTTDVAANSRDPDHRPNRRGADGHLDIRL